jgi:hypothetical protein
MLNIVLLACFVGLVAYILWTLMMGSSLTVVSTEGSYALTSGHIYRIDVDSGVVDLQLPLAANSALPIHIMRSTAGQGTEINILVQGQDEHNSLTSQDNPVLTIVPGSPMITIFESDRVNQWFAL